MQTWSQFPRPRLTLLPEEQLDLLKQSIETRRKIVRHLTLVHASPIPCPQRLSPPLFVPWSQVAKLRGVVAIHKDIEACPYEQLQAALAHPKCLVPGEKEQFLQANNDLLCQLQGSFMPLEGIAPQVFAAIYQRQQGEILWVTVLWMIARLNEYCIACVRLWGKVKPTGRHSPPQMSLKIRNGVLPMAGRQGYMKSPPSSRSRRTLARNGKTSGMAKQPSCTNVRSMCYKQPGCSQLTDGCHTRPFSVVFGGNYFRYSRFDLLPTCQCLGVFGRLSRKIPPTLR